MRKMRSARTRRTRTIDLDINIIILVIGIVFIMFHGRCNNGDCFLIRNIMLVLISVCFV